MNANSPENLSRLAPGLAALRNESANQIRSASPMAQGLYLFQQQRGSGDT